MSCNGVTTYTISAIWLFCRLEDDAGTCDGNDSDVGNDVIYVARQHCGVLCRSGMNGGLVVILLNHFSVI